MRSDSTVRLVVLSDSHLSPRTPEADSNWRAIRRYVAESAPDLVVHAGDLSLDGAHDPSDLDYARARLDELTAAWLAVPGNHDVGDNPGGSPDDNVSPSRLRQWLEVIGPDRWSIERSGWLVLGVNAQLFGTGLPGEAEQWEWAEEMVGRSGRQAIALVIHKPIFADEPEIDSAPWYRFSPSKARRRLSGLLDGHTSVVISGHVHQYRELHDGARSHTWAPTSWALVPDEVQPVMGVKRCGILTVDLTSTGALVELVEPPGLAQLTIGRDMPDPYLH
jgi:3',5'-cyclic AMP phosphodiesterase CpdA